MKKGNGKLAVAGVDPAVASKDAAHVVAPRPGEGGSQDPAAVVKSEDDDEDDDEGQGDDDEDEGEQGAKSLTAGDLAKSLRRLEAFAKSGDVPARKDVLLGKASLGALEKSEREELFELLGGSGVATAPAAPAEAIVKSMNENEDLQSALDVSVYLQEHHTELVKSLRHVGEEIEKSDHRRHEFNLILAKAVTDIGEMVKSLSETVTVMAGQPARAPKSLIATTPAQVLHKSFGGAAPAEDAISKSQILDGLDALMADSMSKGRSGLAENGEDITVATSKYEQTNMISKSMLEAVKGTLRSHAA